MTCCPGALPITNDLLRFFQLGQMARSLIRMNSFLEPLLAILAIVVPLGLAYAIIMLQTRDKRRKNCNDSNPE